MSAADRQRFIPIVGEDAYKVILRPSTAYDSTRRTIAFPERGISYVYGVTKGGVDGVTTEIIEVWFRRKGWTASSVVDWMQEHGEALPTPSRERPAPDGRPALAGGAT
jgi:hypothetical protein